MLDNEIIAFSQSLICKSGSLMHPQCLRCSAGVMAEVRLLDCGTKVSVVVLSCMILLSVSQFNREAFGE